MSKSMDLDKIIVETLEKLKETNYVKDLVESRLKSAIENTIHDFFRYDNPIRKAIKDGLTASLNVAVENITFPEYSHQVCNWIKEGVSDYFEEKAKESINKNLEKFFEPLNKDSYLLSELIEEFKENIEETDEISLHVDFHGNKKDWFWVYLDESAGISQYMCNIQFACNGEGIWNLKIDGKELSKAKTPPLMYTFKHLLYKIMVAKIPVINDIKDTEDYIYLSEED